MGLVLRKRSRVALAVAVAAVCLPGWSAVLVPVAHDEILASAARSDGTVGVVAASDASGEWHAQYHRSGWARLLTAAGLRRAVPSLVPPEFAAHVPASPGLTQRADGYFRVETTVRWPWWRPGGGVAWELP
jgi:hypothetical protein